MAASSRLSELVARRLAEQLERFSFHDIIIEVGGRSFECHRFILSACSQYFREVFGNETGLNIPQVLEVSGIDPVTFELILKCVYGAEENFSVDNVEDIWNAAQNLRIDFLCEACENFQFRRLSTDSCVKISIHAKQVNAQSLLDRARQLMIREFHYIRQRDDLLALDFEELKLLVSNDDLEARSEDDIIDVILRWIRWHTSEVNPGSETDVVSTTPTTRPRLLPELLKSTRICLVSEAFLHTLLNDRNVYENRAAFKIARKALMYHLLPGRRHEYCAPYAMHRNRSPLLNVTVVFSFLANGGHNISCRVPNGTWSGTIRPTRSTVSAVTFGNDIYMVSPNDQCILRYSMSSYTISGLTNLAIQRTRCVLVCVDSYIYIIGGAINISIQRFNAQEEQRATNSVWLETVGNLQLEMDNIMATAIDKYIVVFGRRNDNTLTSVQSFNTSSRTTHVYPNNFMGEHAPMVSFKNETNTFVLLETGELWKLVNCNNQELTMEFKGRLFNERLSLHGATIFNKELLILATDVNPQSPKEFSTRRIQNVDEVKIIEGNGAFLLNTVVTRHFLTVLET